MYKFLTECYMGGWRLKIVSQRDLLYSKAKSGDERTHFEGMVRLSN